MGVILRTAGESRTKAEIKRDYEYLMRLWENVRSLTLQSTAPALVYEEGSLIKRSVRDLYNKDIDEILVAGDDGYREAKDFMRMLMPSHAKVVQPYRETTPIFARFGIEAQLDRMLQPQVTLKSGGYIIINQTEALVAIDVNSGRSTKEHSIEETALHTNLEAAEEVARQLRLRDLAGLIVIDFIDMEENRNNRAVEKRLKDHLKNDRARIQLGRISHFGLMEMSRQRIRASVLESTMKPCPHCGGTGHVRSDSSVALLVVRAIEEFLLKDSRSHIIVKTPASTALYVLNHKRSTLTELEARFGLTITIEVDETVGSQHYAILRGAIAEKPPASRSSSSCRRRRSKRKTTRSSSRPRPRPTNALPSSAAQQPQQRQAEGGEEGNRDRKRRRRRRRRGGRDRDHEHGGPREGAADSSCRMAAARGAIREPAKATSRSTPKPAADAAARRMRSPKTADASEDGQAKKRRRGKRGGKRNRREDADGVEGPGGSRRCRTTTSRWRLPRSWRKRSSRPASEEAAEPEAAAVRAAEEAAPRVEGEEGRRPKMRCRSRLRTSRSRRRFQPEASPTRSVPTRACRTDRSRTTERPAPRAASRQAASLPWPSFRRRRRKGKPSRQSDQPKRSGWWQRKSFF